MRDNTDVAVDAAMHDDHVLGPPPRWTSWGDTILSRIGLRTAFSRDSILAVLVALVGLGLAWELLDFLQTTNSLRLSPLQSTAVMLITAAQSLVLCIRRINPVLCLVVVAASQVALVALLPPGIGIRGLAPFVATYTVCVYPPFRRFAGTVRVITIVAMGEVLGSIAASLLISAPVFGSEPSIFEALFGQGHDTVGQPDQAFAQAASTLLTYAVAVLTGTYVSTHRKYVELARVRTADAIRAQQSRVDAAISAERARMARELHDIAAHHLSGMVVQASAIERLIDKDPAAAKQATTWIRGQGKETLDNLRQVVGVLREPTTADSRGEGGAPVPGLSAADTLIRTARGLGDNIHFASEGEPYPLAPIADVTVYRVLQEALSNARQHAPGAPVHVTLHYGETSVALSVENDPSASHASTAEHRHGLGLVGMRERAQLVDARFDAARTPAGGWRVDLTVPAERPADSTHTGSTQEGDAP